MGWGYKGRCDECWGGEKRIRLTDGEKDIEGSITTSKQLDACAGNRSQHHFHFCVLLLQVPRLKVVPHQTLTFRFASRLQWVVLNKRIIFVHIIPSAAVWKPLPYPMSYLICTAAITILRRAVPLNQNNVASVHCQSETRLERKNLPRFRVTAVRQRTMQPLQSLGPSPA
jgi:hypothetical protein